MSGHIESFKGCNVECTRTGANTSDKNHNVNHGVVRLQPFYRFS